MRYVKVSGLRPGDTITDKYGRSGTIVSEIKKVTDIQGPVFAEFRLQRFGYKSWLTTMPIGQKVEMLSRGRGG